jgi:hypothetical protein
MGAVSDQTATQKDGGRPSRAGPEKFYISVAHTDEDVDRTLEICDQAFRACRG